MAHSPWLSQYPEGVAADIDLEDYACWPLFWNRLSPASATKLRFTSLAWTHTANWTKTQPASPLISRTTLRSHPEIVSR